jgi:hypothetical protein
MIQIEELICLYMHRRKRSVGLWKKDGNTVVNAVVDQGEIAEQLAASF